MNAKTLALFILFLAFGFIAKAEESSEYPKSIENIAIPGGIVYSDGKDAIYYDFGTKESANLTSDFNEVVVKHPFAVSDNGKFLIWLQNSKFYVKELPMGIPHTVQVNKAVWKGTENRRTSTSKDDIIEDIVWQGGDIKNMSLSPDGARFAFDTIFKEIGWVFQGKNIYGESGTITGVYPFYAKMIDSYNGIFYLSTIRNRFSHPRYGNTLEHPPVPRFTASLKDIPLSPYASPPSHIVGIGNYYIRVGIGGESDNGEMICYKGTIKKSAYYLAFQNMQNWEQGKKLTAFIYQIGNQWGPIELRVLDQERQGEPGDEIRQSSFSYFSLKDAPENVQKCREWEILVSSKSCEGLFWKPDGSLTIQSNGDLYSIDALQIQEGINKSKVTKKRKAGTVRFTPVNNVFGAEPKLVAQGINGACISWVSNDAFLFLGRDMLVYLWSQGKKENVLYSPISSEFYYCSRSPFKDIKTPDILTANNKSSDPPAISGTGKAVEGTATSLNAKDRTEDAKINFGPIQIMWRDIQRKDSLGIFLKIPCEEKKPLQFALIEDEDNLDNIKDPSQYEYLSGQKRKVSVVDNKHEEQRQLKQIKAGQRVTGNLISHQEIITEDRRVSMPLDGIIILKLDTAYVALKPLTLRLKYKSVEEVPERVRKNWKKEIERGEVPHIHDLMTYEWKYWPKARESVIKTKTKTWEETLVSKAKKQGWEIAVAPISKEFSIGGIKLLWKKIKPEKGVSQTFSQTFSLMFEIKDHTKDVGSFWKEVRTNIRDPLQYDFRKETSASITYNWTAVSDATLILKVDNKYVAIKPIEERIGWVQYQWKCWPNVVPPAESAEESAETALNK